MVIWFIGLSGTGKSTLAKRLKRYFDKKNINSYLIDGDIVRDFFDRDLGYTEKERKENIKRIILAAKVLEDNNITVIVANISPFEELRDFSRKKLKNYIEIYLKRERKKILNKEEVYNDNNVVGIDINFDEPKNSDLIIDTGDLSVEESLQKIIQKIERLIDED